MDIKYYTNNVIRTVELMELYGQLGWTGYTDHPEKMAKILQGSLWYMSAYDGNKLVGLIRVVGDGCSIVYVQDILVLKDYQRKGIGRKLMESMLAGFHNIRQTVLITDSTEKTRLFYQSMGMRQVGDTGGLCYVRYNRDV
jgi:ribosomal protein S18 acetylase RimI-like enzyme